MFWNRDRHTLSHSQTHAMRSRFGYLFALLLALTTSPASATLIYVDPTGSDANSGDAANPLEHIQTAMNLANAGDEIIVRDGIYNEGQLDTNQAGTAAQRIVVRAENSRGATVQTTAGSRILRVFDPYWTFEGLIFDGQYTTSDLIRVQPGGDFFTLRDAEVINGARDGIDLGDNFQTGDAPDLLNGVTIEDSKFENLLRLTAGARDDAHGIVAGGVRDFTIRNTEVSFTSGDALQLQDGGWDDVLVDGVNFFNAALPEDRGGFLAGVVPGEDGIDTKQDDAITTRGTLTVRNSQIHGWTGDQAGTGFINAAALNMKERVEVILDGNKLYGNDIGIRARGRTGDNGAHITAQNTVFYDNARGVRYEDNVNNLTLYNNTFGASSLDMIENGGGGGLGTAFSALNNLFEDTGVPAELTDPSNLATDASSFVNSAAHNYRLVAGSAAVDAGVTIASVPTDHDGKLRPQGAAYDVGAFEFNATPEPSTLGLLLAGLVSLAGCQTRWRRMSRAM